MARLLLKPCNKSPRVAGYHVLVAPTVEEVKSLLPLDDDDLWAVDIETNGLEAHDPSLDIVGIGLSGPTHTVYINKPTGELLTYLLFFLQRHRLVAFNVLFEDAWFKAKWNVDVNWDGDAFGLFKQLSGDSNQLSWSLEAAQADVLGWPSSNKITLAANLAAAKLSKAEMWKLPPEVLGNYCCGDADSTYQLWEILKNLTIENYPELWTYHTKYFMNEVKLLSEAQLRGITINKPMVIDYIKSTTLAMEAARREFEKHPLVAPIVDEFNKAATAAYLAAEPEKLTKDGALRVNWCKWRAKEKTLLDEHGFNVNSPAQLKWLFYDRLGFKPQVFTKTNAPSTGKKALPLFGEPGEILLKYKKKDKNRSYAQSLLEKVEKHGKLHPQFKSVGTITGRLGGSGGLNVQQQPKDIGYLAAWESRPGHTIIQSDLIALEPVILTQFSQDKNLLALYGPGVPENDVYLYFGAHAPGLQEKIRRYYDPTNPTIDGIEKAKKECKRERSIAKQLCLASSYGAGIKKIHETLTLSGIPITLAEVKTLHAAYWSLFGGIKAWDRKLNQIRAVTGGWFPSMLGCPIPVAEDFVKDSVNRHTQRSGHEFLQVWLYYINHLRHARHVRMYPWIPDLHDGVMFEAVNEDVEEAVKVFNDALALANETCALEIPLKAPPSTGPNFGAVKMPKDWEDFLELLEEEDDDVSFG